MEKHTIGLATEVLIMAIVISVILLFLGIGVLVLIHVCIVGRTLRTTDVTVSERNTHMVERGSMGSTSMSQEDIEKLPCFDFAAKASGGSPIGDCAVCLDGFKAGERCRLLPSCNHSFHAECVDLWLLRTPICPICRAAAADDDLGLGEREEAAAAAAADGDERESFQIVGFLDNDATESQTREGVSSSERMIEVRERPGRI